MARALVSNLLFTLGVIPVSLLRGSLFEDSRGRLWAGVDSGLFQIENQQAEKISLKNAGIDAIWRGATVRYITEASDGSLWGCSRG